MPLSRLSRTRLLLILTALTPAWAVGWAALAGPAHPPSVKTGAVKPHAGGGTLPTATPLYSFQGGADGRSPTTSLVRGSDGNFYGTTSQGGGYSNHGTAFRVTPAGVKTVLAPSIGHAADPDTGIEGGYSISAPLVEGLNPDGTPSGAFYGVTNQGGYANGGTAFLLAPDAASATGYTITDLHVFYGGPSDGQFPTGSLVPGRNADGTFDGYYYGTTQGGGNGYGTVFKMTPSGIVTVVHTFAAPDPNGQTSADGWQPNGGLVQAQSADGTYQDAFLGVASYGGADAHGTVFQVTREDQFTDVHDFTGRASDGGRPRKTLTRGGDGAYYGITPDGGPSSGGYSYGTVFRLAPDASGPAGYAFSTILDLTGENRPDFYDYSGLTLGADGALYGATPSGAASGPNGLDNGAVFRIAPDSSSATGYSLQRIFPFTDPTKGDYPEATTLAVGTDGDLYGTTVFGGPGGHSGNGTVFRLNPHPNPAPTITPPVGYANNGDGTATLTINGTNFVAGCVIGITNVSSGTTLTATFVSAAQLTAGLSLALPGGDHVVTVTNPDGQFATATLTTVSGPTITPPVGYVAHPNGSATVTINGANFQPGATVKISGLYNDSNPQTNFVGSTQLTVELSDIVSAGDHVVTVTNPDGQSATATLTVSGPPVISGVTYHANGDGTSTVTINGTGFQRGCTVNVTTVYTGTTLSARFVSSAQVTVTLSQALPPGSHTVTVTNPDGQTARASFTVADAPTITPPIGYANNGDGTATLTINGTGFQPFCAVSVAPSPSGASYPIQDFSPTQLSVQSPLLSPGAYTVTVTNPDGQSASATLTLAAPSAPRITHLSYVAHADGSSDLTVDGANFVDTPGVSVANVASGTQLRLTSFSPTRLILHLNAILPAGLHTVKVTNPDGQSASSTLVTYGKPRVAGAVAIAQQGGDVYLVVTGAGFQPGGLNGDIGGAAVIVRGPHGQVVSGAQVLGGPGTPPTIGSGPQQYIVDLGHPANSLGYSVEVVNPDGETSDPTAVSTRAQPMASSAPARFNVYTSSHTEYQVSWFERVLQFLHLQFLLNPSGNASPTQLLPGDVSLLHNQPCLVTPTGPGSTAMGLIGQDGNGIVAQGGGNAFPVTGLLGPVGAAAARPGQEDIVAQGGGNLIGQDGNGIVAQGGGNIVAQGGGNLIGQDGNGLIGQDGNGLIGQDGNGLIGQDGNGIVAQGGGNFISPRLRPEAASAPPAVSFTLGRFDEGAENGTGPTDAQVIGTGPDGSDVLILSLRYTPGQPDVVTYAAPGLVLTPTGGTPDPQVLNPAPTLTGLGPSAVAVGSGDTTLAVTGTLFTGGSVVRVNGQAVATTVLTGTRLTAVVPAALLARTGSLAVTVVNPAPGGGASGALPLTVGTPTVNVRLVLSRAGGGPAVATITVSNAGTIDVANVRVTGSTLGGAPGTVSPAGLGLLPAGASRTVTATYASFAGGAGSRTVAKVSGVYDGGAFGGSFSVAAP